MNVIAWRQRVQLVIAVALFAMLCGCTGSRTSTATGGIDFTMYMRDATQAEMYYEVHRDGTIGFGGGMKARLSNTTWTGTMTPEELAEFRQMLAAQQWFKQKPESTFTPEKQVYRVEINAPENHRKFTVKGESDRLRPIQQLLARICMRRLEDDLKILPPPSSQR